MELIPGLPNDVAMDCLVRVPFNQISKAASVCKDWKIEIQLPEFCKRRKAAGMTRPLIAMTQARINPIQHGHVDGAARPLNYQLTLFDPERGIWYEVPPIPGFPDGLPMFCQLVGVGSNLVVMGGFDPVTWKTLKSVFIYDFLTATWRHGSDMPGGQRSFFGCASDCDRTVLVAGGHDGDKNALRSAMMYDVAKDEWFTLADMARERDECKCIFHRGRFHVIGGYCTERQGNFEKSAEAIDVDTCQWDMVEDFLPNATCLRNCVSNCQERLYTCQGGGLFVLENSNWEILGALPADVDNVVVLTAWQQKIFVISLGRSSGVPGAYVINLENGGLTRFVTPHDHSGHVQSCCILEV